MSLRNRFQGHAISSALVLLAALPTVRSAAAQDGYGGPALVLDEIVVDGRTTDADAVTFEGGNATRIGADVLEREFSGTDLTTVLDSLAGVSTNTVTGDPSIGVNIRGLQEDGRVAVTIDGARQNFSRSGHSANTTFFADPEMLRSVEVIRGPAGSGAAPGAIGGTLALRTVSADDLIASDEDRGAEVRLRFGDLHERPTVHASVASRLGDDNDLLFAITSLERNDYTAPDDTEVLAKEETLSLLGKYSHTFAGNQTLTFALSNFGSDYMTGSDSIPRRNRVDTTTGTLNFDGSAGVFHTLKGTLYHADTRVAQQRIDDDGDPVGQRRFYKTESTGLRGEARTDLSAAAFDHQLTFVLDGVQDRVTVDDPNAAGGSLTAPGTRSVWSFLAEDTISLGARTEVILGVRYDTYRLDSDEGTVDGSGWSPSLTLRHHWGPVTLHAVFAEAFRPPTLSEALVNGEHPEPADFLILPNPDLEPEQATTFELGATVGMEGLVSANDRLTGRLAFFRSDVRDYIGLVSKGTLFNPYFQYENIDHVRLEGAELEVAYDAERVFARFSGQTITGTNQDTDEAVSGVAPDGYQVTAGWRTQSQRTEIGARYTFAAAREDGTLSSDAWNTWDVFINQNIGDDGLLNLSLNNITNELYTPYLTTQPAPGFNARASLIWEF